MEILRSNQSNHLPINCYSSLETNLRNFRRLLRVDRSAKRKEQSAESVGKKLDALTIACCLVPHAYFHLITLSARNNTDCEMLRPISLAVLRLMTNSNFVDCSTGNSAGLLPFKILST